MCDAKLEAQGLNNVIMARPPNLALPAFEAATSISLRFAPPFTVFPSATEVEAFPEIRQLVAQFLWQEKGHAGRHWPKLIRAAYPELVGETLEDMLVKLVVRCLIIRNDLLDRNHAALHDFIEFCCGDGNLTYQCHSVCDCSRTARH